MKRRDTKSKVSRKLLLQLVAMTVASFAFGFALVPLYDVFCEITGLRTTFESADSESLNMQPDPNRIVTIEFIASRNQNAPWEFKPSVTKMKVHPGKLYDTTFFARNLTDTPLIGVATPDLSPATASKYFQKTECFCFNEQAFAANEERDMLVRFIVDPELPAYVDTVTLSYTFFTSRSQTALLGDKQSL